ncbi:hypothetical protein J6590_094486, partial [Homalodisca vitripennis]
PREKISKSTATSSAEQAWSRHQPLGTEKTIAASTRTCGASTTSTGNKPGTAKHLCPEDKLVGTACSDEFLDNNGSFNATGSINEDVTVIFLNTKKGSSVRQRLEVTKCFSFSHIQADVEDLTEEVKAPVLSAKRQVTDGATVRRKSRVVSVGGKQTP